MTRLRFLLTSTIILGTALILVYTAEVMDEYRWELQAEVETEQARIASMEREKAELTQRNSELTKTLHNRTSTLSRGGRPGGWLAMPVTEPSSINAVFFEWAFAGTGLEGIGGALADAEAETGVSALVLAGIISLESAWGESWLACERNNLGGLGAFDGREDECGMSFDSREESILFLARLLRDRPGTVEEIGEWYASDPRWARKVMGCMELIAGGGTDG